MIRPLLSTLLILLLAPCARAQSVDALVSGQLGGLTEIYKDIHAHPELSHHEERTAGIVAAELRRPDTRSATTSANTLTVRRPLG